MKTKSAGGSGGRAPLDWHGTLGTWVRVILVALAILFQLVLLMLMTTFLRMYAAPVYVILDVLAIVTVFTLINRHDSSAYRLAWVVFVLITPIFGMFLYWAWGRVDFNKKEKGAMDAAFKTGFARLSQDEGLMEDFSSLHADQAPYVHALAAAHYPVYRGTQAEYFPVGEAYFDRLERDLEGAKKFILLEYFIVAQGELWERIHALLQRKLREGVEVWFLYDDVGCFFKIPSDFEKRLRAEGFHVAVFSPAHRFISNFYLNYRNHQKIAVVDGQAGYVGGVNLADEYINVNSKLGHWKDTGVRLEGSAVLSLTTIFFQMWNIATHNAYPAYEAYLNARPVENGGYFQPYADGPANNPQNPALDLIRQAAGGARKYLWMTSPYLVIDQELSADFARAARGGIDVRIIMPAKPDHWYVGLLNRHNYRHLLRNGVRIYEYTPGFIHGKLLVFDDKCATVGSVNLDFRSLYLHYENGVLICDDQAVLDVKSDIERTMAMSREITLEDVNARPWYLKLLASLFNLFSPLM